MGSLHQRLLVVPRRGHAGLQRVDSQETLVGVELRITVSSRVPERHPSSGKTHPNALRRARCKCQLPRVVACCNLLFSTCCLRSRARYSSWRGHGWARERPFPLEVLDVCDVERERRLVRHDPEPVWHGAPRCNTLQQGIARCNTQQIARPDTVHLGTSHGVVLSRAARYPERNNHCAASAHTRPTCAARPAATSPLTAQNKKTWG